LLTLCGYQAEKVLQRIHEEGLVPKPFVPKRRSFTFPPVEKMGQRVRWKYYYDIVIIGNFLLYYYYYIIIMRANQIFKCFDFPCWQLSQ
jgi:hypothetical protein